MTQRAKFSGKYLVVKIDGELSIGNGRAQFKGEDPGFLWRNRAKDYIQGKLAKYLDPNGRAGAVTDELTVDGAELRKRAVSERRERTKRERDSAIRGGR